MSKKKNRRVLLIALIGLLPGLLFGCSPKGTIFGGRIMDGDGMINPFGPMLDALAGDWESGDGAWQAAIDGYSIKLLRGGTPVLDGSFSLNLSGEGEDINEKTELALYDCELGEEGGAIASVGQLYSENGKLYMRVEYPDGSGEEITFTKTAE